MQPGDIVEWHYSNTRNLVMRDEQLLMPSGEWVEIGSNLVHIIVAIDDDQITWLNSRGTFSKGMSSSPVKSCGMTVCPDTLDSVSAFPRLAVL